MRASPAAACQIVSDLPEVPGLRAYWAHATGQPDAASPPEMQVRLLLDTLGLGTEQAALFLGAAPSFDSFTAWIVETAGLPDPLELARYEAWLAGRAPPAAILAQQQALAEAPPVLDEADFVAWDRDGFVVVRDAITRAEARAAEAVLWVAVGASPDDPDSWYGNARSGIWVHVYQHLALDAARRSPRIRKAFAQLWGREDLWMAIDRLSFNPPERPGYRFPRPELHWDTSLARPIAFSTQAILYLTDTASDQGALRLVPGFHRRLDAWLDSLGDTDPRRVDLRGEAAAIPAGAGDLIIWRADLPHAASPNRADRPRLAQYLTMYPADLVNNPVWL